MNVDPPGYTSIAQSTAQTPQPPPPPKQNDGDADDRAPVKAAQPEGVGEHADVTA